MPTPGIGVVVVTFRAVEFIDRTLQALLDETPDIPIVVVDNASDDDTTSIVGGYPVRLVQLPVNRGYAAAVRAGVDALDTSRVVVLNHDVVVRPGWLPPLVAVLDDPKVGSAMPTIELLDRPGTFNTSGGAVTCTGIAWVTDVGRTIASEPTTIRVPFPSGAAFAMRREVWNAVDGMWDDLFLYGEDVDLGWRLHLGGWSNVRVSASRVAHDYAFARTEAKLWLLERNRWRLLRSNYRRSTLWLLAPVIVLHEIGVLVSAARDGWFGGKVATWRQLAMERSTLADRRRRLQGWRRVGDASVLRAFDGRLATIDIPGVKVPAGTRLVDALSAVWVRLILSLVARRDRRLGLRA